jgi:hypothetical protein
MTGSLRRQNKARVSCEGLNQMEPSLPAAAEHACPALLDLPESVFDSILDHLDATVISNVLRPSCSQMRARLDDCWWALYCQRTFAGQSGLDYSSKDVPAGGAMHIALRCCAFQNLQGVRWGRLPNFPFSSEGHAGVAIGRNVWVSARAATAAQALQHNPREDSFYVVGGIRIQRSRAGFHSARAAVGLCDVDVARARRGAARQRRC